MDAVENMKNQFPTKRVLKVLLHLPPYCSYDASFPTKRVLKVKSAYIARVTRHMFFLEWVLKETQRLRGIP